MSTKQLLRFVAFIALLIAGEGLLLYGASLPIEQPEVWMPLCFVGGLLLGSTAILGDWFLQ